MALAYLLAAANINVRGKEPDKTDLAAMARAQNDVYMDLS